MLETCRDTDVTVVVYKVPEYLGIRRSPSALDGATPSLRLYRDKAVG